ncbi:leucine-rich repeat receptor-like serine/threonine/tyrosine-protein kinase SOBIR1 [Pyrus ussuriensis x Pyrus communis]|uniref:non-specific serine/threonine protein kinase n=1 Tax=Pyrus ussuriensis x Pyrus communis TaxID=2448454 RepID=A0A5N5I4B8_9ROSA|nr:leucine-rich repeat receptor-like serine/threonine/tyrosine-protein kinase SOBIR1 [Pyrus ussuriensis x Pyrus communis]
MKIIEISATDVPKRYSLAENTSTKGHNNTTAAANAQAPTNALAPGPSTTPKQKKNNKKLLLALVEGGGKDGGPAIFRWRGRGDFYKAELPGSNGKIIAIKKIINTVGKIRHRNLVPLLAHVSRPDCHYLVYEFMKNGSLKDMLNQVANGTRQLDWLTRHNIALGVAAGLEYLHTNNTPQIIHGALGAANILLDGDMEARIADFGQAKAMPDGQTHILIFNISGALPSDEFFQNTNEMSLVKWMRNVMTSENPRQAIDPKLLGNGYEEQMLLVLKIACFCTLDNPKERPNSKDVRCMLSQIKH